MKKKTTAKKTKPVELKLQKVEDGQLLPVVVEEHHLPTLQHTPDSLIAMAIQKGGINIEVLERLSKLQMEWLDRQAKSAFLLAKSKFQAELPILKKTKNVNYESKSESGGPVNYFYAPLGKIAQSLQPLLDKWGMSYDWDIEDFYDDKGVPKIRVTCIVSHIGGHSKRTTMEAYHDSTGNKPAIKARASTVSYLQRYTLIGALGLSTDDADDDGGSAHNEKQESKPKEKPTAAKPAMSVEQLNKAILRITKGEDILAECKQQFTLTEKQITALNSADDVRKVKAEKS